MLATFCAAGAWPANSFCAQERIRQTMPYPQTEVIGREGTHKGPDWGRYAPDFAEATYILCVAGRAPHTQRVPGAAPTVRIRRGVSVSRAGEFTLRTTTVH